MTVAIVPNIVPMPKTMFITFSYVHGFTTGFAVTPDEGRRLMTDWATNRKVTGPGGWLKRLFGKPPVPFVLQGDDWAVDTTGVVSVRLVQATMADGETDSPEEMRFKKEFLETQLQLARERLRLMRREGKPEWQQDADGDDDDANG